MPHAIEPLHIHFGSVFALEDFYLLFPPLFGPRLPILLTENRANVDRQMQLHLSNCHTSVIF